MTRQEKNATVQTLMLIEDHLCGWVGTGGEVQESIVQELLEKVRHEMTTVQLMKVVRVRVGEINLS